MDDLARYAHLIPAGYGLEGPHLVKHCAGKPNKVLSTAPVLVLSFGNLRARVYIRKDDLDYTGSFFLRDLDSRAGIVDVLTDLGLFDAVVRDGAGPIAFRRYIQAAIHRDSPFA